MGTNFYTPVNGSDRRVSDRNSCIQINLKKNEKNIFVFYDVSTDVNIGVVW